MTWGIYAATGRGHRDSAEWSSKSNQKGASKDEDSTNGTQDRHVNTGWGSSKSATGWGDNAQGEVKHNRSSNNSVKNASSGGWGSNKPTGWGQGNDTDWGDNRSNNSMKDANSGSSGSNTHTGWGSSNQGNNTSRTDTAKGKGSRPTNNSTKKAGGNWGSKEPISRGSNVQENTGWRSATGWGDNTKGRDSHRSNNSGKNANTGGFKEPTGWGSNVQGNDTGHKRPSDNSMGNINTGSGWGTKSTGWGDNNNNNNNSGGSKGSDHSKTNESSWGSKPIPKWDNHSTSNSSNFGWGSGKGSTGKGSNISNEWESVKGGAKGSKSVASATGWGNKTSSWGDSSPDKSGKGGWGEGCTGTGMAEGFSQSSTGKVSLEKSTKGFPFKGGSNTQSSKGSCFKGKKGDKSSNIVTTDHFMTDAKIVCDVKGKGFSNMIDKGIKGMPVSDVAFGKGTKDRKGTEGVQSSSNLGSQASESSQFFHGTPDTSPAPMELSRRGSISEFSNTESTHSSLKGNKGDRDGQMQIQHSEIEALKGMKLGFMEKGAGKGDILKIIEKSNIFTKGKKAQADSSFSGKGAKGGSNIITGTSPVAPPSVGKPLTSPVALPLTSPVAPPLTSPVTPSSSSLESEREHLTFYKNERRNSRIITKSQVIDWINHLKNDDDLSFTKLNKDISTLAVAATVFICDIDDEHHEGLLKMFVTCFFSSERIDKSTQDECVRVATSGRAFCQFLQSVLETHDEMETCVKLLSLAAVANPEAVNMRQLVKKVDDIIIADGDMDITSWEEFIEVTKMVENSSKEEEINFSWNEKHLNKYINAADVNYVVEDGIIPDLNIVLMAHKRYLLNEFINSLRKGIDQIKRGDSIQNCDVWLCTDTYCTEVVTNIVQIGRFDEMVDWSKQFRTGSLLCLSDDKFCGNLLFAVTDVMDVHREGYVTARLTQGYPGDLVSGHYDVIEAKQCSYGIYNRMMSNIEDQDLKSIPFQNFFRGDINPVCSTEKRYADTLLSDRPPSDDVILINSRRSPAALVFRNKLIKQFLEHNKSVLVLFNTQSQLDAYTPDLENHCSLIRIGESPPGENHQRTVCEIIGVKIIVGTVRSVCRKSCLHVSEILPVTMIVTDATDIPEGELLTSMGVISTDQLILFGNGENINVSSTMKRLLKRGMQPYCIQSEDSTTDDNIDLPCECDHFEDGDNHTTKCDRECQNTLMCAHSCRGLCGEPCPDFCEETYCSVNLDFRRSLSDTTEFTENTKYIQLDCKHIFSYLELDHHISKLMKDESINTLTCPDCSSVILPKHTRRYREQAIAITM